MTQVVKYHGDFDDDPVVGVESAEGDGGALGLLQAAALLRRLDAMIQAVADQMQQGFEQRFDHGLVGAGAGSHDRQIDRLAEP